MINIKDNIWIDGFDSQWEINNIDFSMPNTIYSGKTSDVSEEVAKECVKLSKNESCDGDGLPFKITLYGNYHPDLKNEYNIPCWLITAKESIQSALTKPDGVIFEYCIIFKK